MELWIRSQDKKCLLKADNIKWFGGELYTNDSVFLETIKDGTRYLLGIYSNGKRALEVFDEIQSIIKPRAILQSKPILSIEEIEKSYDMKVLPSCVDVIQPIQTAIVYEMPKE